MKRDPSIEQLLRGDLLAVSPLNFADGRDAMLEALLDLLPAYTQRHPTDPGVALLEALAAVLEIFGFYHDRVLTESKVGSAQLLRSVALLGDVVGYKPRPALAAVTHQFFEARTLGVIAASSKLAARVVDSPAKVIFETLHALPIGPAFNRMAFDPIIARHAGAMRAVIRRIAEEVHDRVTPLDDFPVGAIAMFNGVTGLELTPLAGARSRAVAVSRALRRSYGLRDTHVHCATEVRRLRNGHPLITPYESPDLPPLEAHDDLMVFEVTDRPLLHIPEPTAQRLRSTLEVYVFDREAPDPGEWPAEQRWQEVPDFSASEASDRHYRTFVDDRLHTYIIIRRRLGYRQLLTETQLANIYVRFTPAVGDIRKAYPSPGPYDISGHLAHLDIEFFTSPIVIPKVDGEPTRVFPSNWVVTDKTLGLIPGRQIIIANADTGEKYVRTLGPWTLGQYLSWRHTWRPDAWNVQTVPAVPRPLWDRISEDIIVKLPDSAWMKGLFLQTFGKYFPLGLRPADISGLKPGEMPISYPVLPGIGATHSIRPELLYVEDIPDRHHRVPGWSERTALAVAPLRDAAKAGPYHLWEQFYRHFENLDWRVLDGHQALLEFLENDPKIENYEDNDPGLDEDSDEAHPPVDPMPEATTEFKEIRDTWITVLKSTRTGAVVIVPRGATYIIVQDSSRIGPGDYFLLGKRLRYPYPKGAEDVLTDDPAVDGVITMRLSPVGPHAFAFDPNLSSSSGPEVKPPVESFDPHWMVAEVLQAVEVHGRIVRLKWPTQNQYTVDFQPTWSGEEPAPGGFSISQPVTELIIVPQVASVFFGETFSQVLTLSPSRVLLANTTPPTSDLYHLIEIDKPFGRFALRTRTGWPTVDPNTDPPWNDMFLANFVDGEVWPVVVAPAAAPPRALVWRGYVFVNAGVAQPELPWRRIAWINTPKSEGEVDAAPGVSLVGLDPTLEKGFDSYEVGAAGLDTLFNGLDAVPGKQLWVQPTAAASHYYHDSQFEKSGDEYSIKDPNKYGGVLKPGTLIRLDVDGKPKYARISESDFQNQFKILDVESPIAYTDQESFTLIAVEATRFEDIRASLALKPESLGPDEDELFVAGSVFTAPGPLSSKQLVKDARIPDTYVEHRLAEKGQNLAAFRALLDSVGKETEYQSFSNKISQLDEQRYDSSGVEKFSDDNNFLVGLGKVKYLMLADKSSIEAGKYALFSRSKFLANQSSDGEEKFPGVYGALGDKADVKLQTLTDSIIFNSGNFIPVRFSSNEYDHKIVANSLRIKLEMINGGFAVVHRNVFYKNDLVTVLDAKDALEEGNLFNFGKTPEGVFTLNFVFHGYFPVSVNSATIVIDVIYTAEPYHAEDDPNRKMVPVGEGEDDDEDEDEGGDGDGEQGEDVELKVEQPWVHFASHSFCKDSEVRWKESRFYQFETRPLPWNPLRQLIILNAGELKAGDYLFIEPSGVEKESDSPCNEEQQKKPPPPEKIDMEAKEVADARDFIQWTRVVEVDGRMVMVDPYVKIQPRGFYHYRITGYRRPASAAVPDEDYYALLESENKTESLAEHGLEAEPKDTALSVAKLSFRDRLMLRPFTVVQGDDDTSLRPVERTWLLDNLVPGDRLLVWDKRWQTAWRAYRHDGSTGDEHPWWAWPDYQQEVVIKRIVPHLGIVDLERRMPVRFGIEYMKIGVAPGDRTFASILAFEALMFYREPFQGPRELLAIGDGDRRVKFPRFISSLVAEHGLGSVALDEPGTMASNIETLTFDANDRAWTRWVEFAGIDRAKRKDRAFVLGLEIPNAPNMGQCKDALFPEDVPAAADKDCCCTDLPEPDEGPVGPDEGVPPGQGRKLPRIKLSISFGDGVNGELLPTGRANVFIRPVEIGVWCKHFLVRPRRQLLGMTHACIPFRVDPASPKNIVLVTEHGAHLHWRSREGESSWPSSALVEIDVKGIPGSEDTELDEIMARHPGSKDGVIGLYEVTDSQAREGVDGVVLRPVRPGVVQLSVVMPTDLHHLLHDVLKLPDDDIASRIRVYEDLRVEPWRLDENFYATVLASDPTLSVGGTTVLLGETEGLAERSLLAFSRSEEESGDIEIGEVLSVDHSTYSATLAQGLERVYSLDRSYLFGNVVQAVQGSSERLILGSGDGATSGLRLGLGNREPILYSTMKDGAAGELTPGVTVLVDDIPWDRVDSLEGRGPRERIYRLDIEASGKAFVCFGDGQSGAIPVAGLDNIVAVLRTGDGARGNVPVGAVERLLDGNLTVERTRNVTPGGGGKAADNVDQAREHLMTRSFTHGRVITQDDVLRAVLALGNVVQARVDPASTYAALRVIVALADRQPAHKFVLKELEERLQAVMPLAAGCTVELVDVKQRPVHVVLDVTVNRGFFEGDVILGLEEAFSAADDGFFDPRRWPIGAPLRVGEIYEQAFALPGVATARVRWLSTEVAPLNLPAKVPDILWPGPEEIIRCDSDRMDDPYRARGSFRVQVKRGGK